MKSASLLFVVLLSGHSFTQTGSLDPEFGVDGKVVTPIGNLGEWGNAVAIQNDQKIVVGGYSQNSFTTADFAVTRYEVDGNLDQTFGNNGKVITHIENRSIATTLAIQNDGKIILGGASNWHVNLARYNTNGALDTTFGSGGMVIADIEGYYSERCESLLVQDDGKILVGGYAQHNSNDWSYFFVARYNSNGSIDSTFATNGIVIGSKGQAYSIATQSDGKIILGGQIDGTFAMERYTANGTLDTLFGIDGTVVTPIANSAEGSELIVQDDDKLLLAGTASMGFDDSRFALAGYNSDGSPDNNFGVAGIVTESFGLYCQSTSAQLQSDGKILLVGSAKDAADHYHFVVARYNANGALDQSFGTNGKTTTSFEGVTNSVANSIAVQSDNKIVLTGYIYDTNNVDIALARYLHEDLLMSDKPIENFRYTLYPNPSNGQFYIQLETEIQQGELRVYDSYGQLVAYIEELYGKQIHLSNQSLPSGNYHFQLSENTHVIASGEVMVTEK